MKTKFNPGNNVKIITSGAQFVSYAYKIYPDENRTNMYSIPNWRDIIYTISTTKPIIPYISRANTEEIAYPLEYNGMFVGYIYEYALEEAGQKQLPLGTYEHQSKYVVQGDGEYVSKRTKFLQDHIKSLRSDQLVLMRKVKELWEEIEHTNYKLDCSKEADRNETVNINDLDGTEILKISFTTKSRSRKYFTAISKSDGTYHIFTNKGSTFYICKNKYHLTNWINWYKDKNNVEATVRVL